MILYCPLPTDRNSCIYTNDYFTTFVVKRFNHVHARKFTGLTLSSRSRLNNLLKHNYLRVKPVDRFDALHDTYVSNQIVHITVD